MNITNKSLITAYVDFISKAVLEKDINKIVYLHAELVDNVDIVFAKRVIELIQKNDLMLFIAFSSLFPNNASKNIYKKICLYHQSASASEFNSHVNDEYVSSKIPTPETWNLLCEISIKEKNAEISPS